MSKNFTVGGRRFVPCEGNHLNSNQLANWHDSCIETVVSDACSISSRWASCGADERPVPPHPQVARVTRRPFGAAASFGTAPLSRKRNIPGGADGALRVSTFPAVRRAPKTPEIARSRDDMTLGPCFDFAAPLDRHNFLMFSPRNSHERRGGRHALAVSKMHRGKSCRPHGNFSPMPPHGIETKPRDYKSLAEMRVWHADCMARHQ